MKKFTQRFLRDNKGVTAIEYGLIAGLVVLVIAGGGIVLGTNISTVLTNVADKVASACSVKGNLQTSREAAGVITFARLAGVF